MTVRFKSKEHRSKFRFAEGCLYNYQLNLSKIVTLREKLELLKQSSSVKAQSYEAMPHGGDISRPVEQRTMQIADIEARLANLKSVTQPIARMMESLKREYGIDESLNKKILELVELRYFARGSWPQIADKLQVSIDTLKYWRQQVVELTIEHLCL